MKEKISITLDEKLLERVDSLIDGVFIRNRSQAIEKLLWKALGEKPARKAVLLAGGPEKNLRYKGTYKPLYEINGKPLIVNTLERLRSAGVTEVIVAAGKIKDKIFELIGDGMNYGLRIIYVKDENLGTAGVVKKVKDYLDSTFFVVFGDEYFDFDLGEMLKFHRSIRSLATMAVSATNVEKSKDYLKILGNKVIEFVTPAKRERTFHVNAGIYLFEPEVLSYFPRKGSIERDVFPKLVKEGKLNAFIFSGKWIHLE